MDNININEMDTRLFIYLFLDRAQHLFSCLTVINRYCNDDLLQMRHPFYDVINNHQVAITPDWVTSNPDLVSEHP